MCKKGCSFADQIINNINFLIMRKLSTLFAAMIFAASVNAQSVFYSENMGTPTGTTPIVGHIFQNFAPVTYVGTADVRNNLPSSGYAGFSGGGNIAFNGITRNFIISGIDSRNYSGITMTFGQNKTTNASSNELTVEVSADGTNWTALTYTRPTGSGTNGWLLIAPTGTIPATENLRIRFVQSIAASAQFRLDDVVLTGTDITLGANSSAIATDILVKNTSVKNTITFAVSTDIKIINANGQVVKNAKVNANNTLEVSTLPAGIYFVSGMVNGKLISQKIIKK